MPFFSISIVLPKREFSLKTLLSVVDETVAGRAGRPLHDVDVELGLLIGKGDGGHHVSKQVHGSVESGRGILKTTQI